jgi:hypothetical protein
VGIGSYAVWMDPTIERFRALARSSPWRWSTLRYVQERDPSGRDQNRVRVWIRRPKLARVELLDGTLLRVHRGEPRTVTPLSRRGDAPPVTLQVPSEVEVELDDDELVRQRPGRWRLDTDTVMIGNYYDMAFLDPVELADGGDEGPGATIEDLHVVDHRGRQAWEAVLRPTADYDPLCPCCALLLSEQLEDAGIDLREDEPDFAYPDAHRVRIDVATGVCVYNEQLGGTRNGSGHDLAIEAVDEPMGDEHFPQPPPSRWARFLGRR